MVLITIFSPKLWYCFSCQRPPLLSVRQTIRLGCMSCCSSVRCPLFSFVIFALSCLLCIKTGDFDDKENMLTLLIIPGEVARWVSAVFGNLFPHINLSEQIS